MGDPFRMFICPQGEAFARKSRDSRMPVLQLGVKLSLPVLAAVVHAQDQRHIVR